MTEAAPIEPLPSFINPEWMARFVEALLSQRDFCIMGQWGAFARRQKALPWRWARIYPKWYVELIKERRKMLQVTGKAEFSEAMDVIQVEVRLQPTTPYVHDVLERVAKHYQDADIAMEKGNLVLKLNVLVPAEETKGLLAASAGEPTLDATTESAPPSPSTSVKTEKVAVFSVDYDEGLPESYRGVGVTVNTLEGDEEKAPRKIIGQENHPFTGQGFEKDYAAAESAFADFAGKKFNASSVDNYLTDVKKAAEQKPTIN